VAADGSERWLAVRGKFVRSELSPQGSLIGVARDITMGKQAELQIRRLNQELEARVRERTVELEATVGELEAFSYTISHDLRAPLRAISGFAEIVREDCSEDRAEHTRDYLARIVANAERMSRMIDDLLRFSRMARSPLQRSRVKPEQIAAELLRDLAFPEAARAEIRIHSMPACHGDPALLRQVYANLISNALKYSRDAERPLVEIGSGTGEGGNPVYFVKDNGVGFDPTYADKLFGVFQRLHKESQFEGNGVGLAITQRIIQRHGGTIWANAVPGQGATFFFTLGGPTGAHLKP
jgi:light-regulated signal transduction histidine kinase (bacteriophytochrome)